MGITPITNLMPLPDARVVRGALEPAPMERVEGSARTGDETYSPSGGKSTRGSEDDASDDDDVEVEGEKNSEAAHDAGEEFDSRSSAQPISFFA